MPSIRLKTSKLYGELLVIKIKKYHVKSLHKILKKTGDFP